MPVPSRSHMVLVGGASSANSTIFTSSLIKIGDVIKITGVASNNNVFTVIDIVDTKSTGEAAGTSFTDLTGTTTSSGNTIRLDGDDAKVVEGLSVAHANIPSDTFIDSVAIDLSSGNREITMNNSITSSIASGQTITFADQDIYYCLKGGTVTNESSAGSTDPIITVVRAPGDKLCALGDVDGANGVDVWSDNATTDYAGTSPASADGWEAAAISPTLNGDDAKYIYHYVDNALRVCNINETNQSTIKWYGYIQRQQFNLNTGLIFAEWQEHRNNLAAPQLSGSLTEVYGTASHDNTTASNYYQNNRGVVRPKRADSADLKLKDAHNSSTTSFTFQKNDDSETILDQAISGEVITIDEALGTYPREFLFCKKESGTAGATITYSRAYGGALVGTAPDSYSDNDTPILERGLGFNLGITDGTADGDWAEGTYEFYQSFIYDGNQESLPFQMGDGTAASSLAAFTHASDGATSLRVSVYADLGYSGRITGGRIYTRLQNTDDDLILLVDIDIVKGIRTSLDGDHAPWSYESGKGYYVLGPAVGNAARPNLDTYTTINGFSPDVNFVAIGGSGEIYKTSIVANRRTFIANVKIKTMSGELEKYGDRIMYSEINKFDTFLEHNFIDVSKGDYGEYVTLQSYADRLLAFKHNLVHVINIASPSASGWYLEDTIKYVGVNFPFSVAKTNNGIAWVSDDGCYLYDGRSVKNLLGRKLAVSEAAYSTSTDSVTWNDWYRGTAHLKDVMLGYDPISNSLIMMRSPNNSTNNSEQAWIYDFDTDGWVFDNKIFTDSGTYTNFITDWNKNLTLGFQNSNDVEFKKYLPAQVAKENQRFVTKDIDFGQPGLIKKIYKIIVTYKSNGSHSTPFAYSINGRQSYASFTGDFANTTSEGGNTGLDWDILTATPSSPISCQSIQIKFNEADSAKFEINDITIQYRVLGVKEAT